MIKNNRRAGKCISFSRCEILQKLVLTMITMEICSKIPIS